MAEEIIQDLLFVMGKTKRLNRVLHHYEQQVIGRTRRVDTFTSWECDYAQALELGTIMVCMKLVVQLLKKYVDNIEDLALNLDIYIDRDVPDNLSSDDEAFFDFVSSHPVLSRYSRVYNAAQDMVLRISDSDLDLFDFLKDTAHLHQRGMMIVDCLYRTC